MESYLQLVHKSVEVVSQGLRCQDSISSLFTLMTLYKQYINCLYGNERLAKTRLVRSRGFGLPTEFFDDNLNLNPYGLLQSQEIIKTMPLYIQGKKKQVIFQFICLIIFLASVFSSEVVALNETQILSYQKQTSILTAFLNEATKEDEEFELIPFHDFLYYYKRKHRRYVLKYLAASIVSFYMSTVPSIENVFLHASIEIKIKFARKLFVYSSSCFENSFMFLKMRLITYDFDCFKELWQRTVIEKRLIEDEGEVLCKSLLRLIEQASRMASQQFGVVLLDALIESDTIAR